MLKVSGIKVDSPDIVGWAHVIVKKYATIIAIQISGKSPLMLAAEGGSSEIVNMLMENKASPNKTEVSLYLYLVLHNQLTASVCLLLSG